LLLCVDIKKECQVSEQWYDKFIFNIKRMKSDKELLLYLYNVYLNGSKLGSIDNNSMEKYD